MSEVLLYHHVQGLTDGVRSFADELRQAGHTVHTPDLFDGQTFGDDRGGYGVRARGGLRRARRARRRRRRRHSAPDVVYAGFSFGVMIAQQLAQTRPGARGALLMYGVPSRLGVRRRVAGRRSGAGARQGGRRVLRRGPRRRPRARRRRPSTPSCSSIPATSISSRTPRSRYDPDAAALLIERVLRVPRRSDDGRAPTYTIKALDESTWDAFAALVEANNGVFGGCWCIGFHPEGRDKDDAGAQPPNASSSASEQGTTHAALVFDGDDCLGWCQFGSPEEVPRIKSRAAVREGRVGTPRLADRVQLRRQGPRRRGVATAGLAGALELIAGLGRRNRRGLPGGAEAVPAGFLFNGALTTYERLGFTRDRKIGKHRWVVPKGTAAAVTPPAADTRGRRGRRARTSGRLPC